ncbi:sensor histidine kinase [Halonotius sp. GCM10025705]|uniref:sensor histidine kinase n=1 Tax=Halonotius sp. GCM10025705 TaxID=3252678 RepID=UPI00360E94C5
MITGDPGRLQHIFENLFRNAIEHGGTDVTIRVGQIDTHGIYVEDTGSGIPEDAREAVFDAGHTSTSGGTGFGLTIVKRIAEAHGWEVKIVEGIDGGARFEFTGVDIDQ